MAKFVRVNLPVDRPKDTLDLAEDIIEENTELGAGSVLTDFVDMAAFALKVTNAATLQKDGDKRTRTAQKKYLRAAKKCGLAKGQTKDTENTVQWYVVEVRDILLLKNRGTEEDLSEFGFNVVISQTGARRNVRIDMPTIPQGMIELANDIIEQHEELDVDSPLTPALVDMVAFETLVGEAETLLNEWNTAKNQAQVFHGQALNILGYAAGQTSDSEGTLYFDICLIRDRLLQVHRGTEEDLSDYGFDVVISEAVTGRKKGESDLVVLQITVEPGMDGDLDLASVEGEGTPTTVDLEAQDAPAKFFAAATADGAPGIGPFIEVAANDKKSRTPEQLTSQIGIGDTKPFLKVQNSGTETGTYTVTLHFEG